MAFSEGISSSVPKAALVAQAAACQMIFFLHVGQVALLIISPDIQDANININRFSPSDKRMLGSKFLGPKIF